MSISSFASPFEVYEALFFPGGFYAKERKITKRKKETRCNLSWRAAGGEAIKKKKKKNRSPFSRKRKENLFVVIKRLSNPHDITKRTLTLLYCLACSNNRHGTRKHLEYFPFMLVQIVPMTSKDHTEYFTAKVIHFDVLSINVNDKHQHTSIHEALCYCPCSKR